MSTQSAPNSHELENAFSTFNGLSEQLATTYKVLISQVAILESELVKTRGQRYQNGSYERTYAVKADQNSQPEVKSVG